MPGEPLTRSGAEHADLERLAAALRSRGYQARVVARQDRRPYVHVQNPQAEMLTERIYAEGGFFVWSWGQPVARRDQLTEAVDSISRVLRTVGP